MKKILSKLRSNPIGFKIGRKILSTPAIVNNPVYNYFYNKRIEKTARELEKKPPGVVIGTTNLCNANCIMCPHPRIKTEDLGTMDNVLYKKIIDEAAEIGTKSVCLSFFGEPLLDNKIVQRVAYAKSKNLNVSFFSNGSLLTKKKAKKLINAGLDSITISFDSYKKETFEKIRKNLKFGTVRNNIKSLINIKEKLRRDNPRINLALVEQKDNKHEINNFYKEWKSKVDNINIINIRNWESEIETDPDSYHFNKKISRPPCKLIWSHIVVDWNGDVVLCCVDWSHRAVLGNLKRESIKDIWWGDKLKRIRELHKERKFDKIPLCNECNKKTVWW